MAQSNAGTVALVRELLLLEADEVLAGDRIEDAAPAEHEERRLHVARRLYDAYNTTAQQELKKLLRQLPTMASVLADAMASWTAKHAVPKSNGEHDAWRNRKVPSAESLLSTHADSRQLELARLRAWAARQLARTKGVKTHGADIVRVYVYRIRGV
jgi:hypothetical protein